MIIEPAGCMLHGDLHCEKLPAHIIDKLRLTKLNSIAGLERAEHVQAIEPHLIRIDFLVPVGPRCCPRLMGQLSGQRPDRLLIGLPASCFPQRKELFPRIDLIEVEFIDRIAPDRPVFQHELIDTALHRRVEQPGETPPRQLSKRRQQHSGLVIPLDGPGCTISERRRRGRSENLQIHRCPVGIHRGSMHCTLTAGIRILPSAGARSFPTPPRQACPSAR